jgi:hypothetical protein
MAGSLGRGLCQARFDGVAQLPDQFGQFGGELC